MNRYNVLGHYLPAFSHIGGLMQYDLFPTLTVDEHILYVVRTARRFAMQRYRQELPFCSQVMDPLSRPELLSPAAVSHALTNGPGGDHTEIGASGSALLCLRTGTSSGSATQGAGLVT